ncbi:hypothetical protein BOTBODRAFT_357294 [Botryobasidium botryosum FD-172 SS1]|uniref:Uncharacterized protein n=1 Tax=Botryobasidium botryosum (strain FD-172 SS1) TaxID=930990 RepID=A0A067MQZ0_BOTB1|nr:hypothetical protein BOTBODRAFT_357294 [Botryobasidium botryosum FD-172 SS1]
MRVRDMGKIVGCIDAKKQARGGNRASGRCEGCKGGKGVKVGAQNARGCRDNDSTTTGLQSVSQKIHLSPRARATEGERHTTTGTSPVAGTPAAKEARTHRGNGHTKKQKVKQNPNGLRETRHRRSSSSPPVQPPRRPKDNDQNRADNVERNTQNRHPSNDRRSPRNTVAADTGPSRAPREREKGWWSGVERNGVMG